MTKKFEIIFELSQLRCKFQNDVLMTSIQQFENSFQLYHFKLCHLQLCHFKLSHQSWSISQLCASIQINSELIKVDCLCVCCMELGFNLFKHFILGFLNVALKNFYKNPLTLIMNIEVILFLRLKISCVLKQDCFIVSHKKCH